LERTVTILNKAGIHVRPAAQIAELANKFKANIILAKDGVEVNAKSIMDLLTLSAGQGIKLIIKAEGEDSEEAIDAIESLINSKFSEE
jgi:phosphocarrier protein